MYTQSVLEGGFKRLLSNYGQSVMFPGALSRSFLIVVVRKEDDGN
jgi:hypothetical protein